MILSGAFKFSFSYVDNVLVMAYDYHGNWNNKTGVLSPLYSQTGDAQLWSMVREYFVHLKIVQIRFISKNIKA